ncbi:MAG: response regulator transcription factor [Alphaproteobacteria bacterium]|nr:response regulator transcription factor [Alphaproteobacteria bacterium]MBU0796907.1 response regulator transcription factor [Alphaproteobacteria bacterium]MBU0886449.1 response regulator transcription factor [Alphaproteobacteria bacterium]MBU1812328.1 response regulator transcription factor [Alphaproteobacteria bacterium]
MTTQTPRIALIEDNDDLREELVFFLKSRGSDVWGASSAEDFWKRLHRNAVDIVLVDLGLPGEDGFSVIEYLNEMSGFGLIVVSARGGQPERLRGLTLGADIYMVKPVNFARLAEEIDKLWARIQGDGASDGTALDTAPPQKWSLDASGSCLIDPAGKALRLTAQEFALLQILYRNPSQVYAKEILHDQLFEYDEHPETHRVDVILSRLRKKAREQHFRLPIRAIFGKGVVFIDS